MDKLILLDNNLKMNARLLFVVLMIAGGFKSMDVHAVESAPNCSRAENRGISSTSNDGSHIRCEVDLKLTPEERQRYEVLVNIIREMNKTSPIQWKSIFLRQRGVELSRAKFILTELFLENSPLNLEIARKQREILQVNLWNIYLHLYDSFLMFSDGYREIFALAHNVLPKRGVIGVLGYGSGNDAASLAALAPGRQIVGVDSAKDAYPIAEEKMHLLSERLKVPPAQLIISDLADYEPDQLLDGAIMNNVLYSIGAKEPDLAKRRALRLELLKKIYKYMKPGSTFALNDPNLMGREKLHDFLERSAESGVKNRMVITEEGFALNCYVNIQFLASGNLMMEKSERESLVKEAGFIIEQQIETYYGTSTMMVLKKPASHS